MSGKLEIPPQPDHSGLEVDHTKDNGYAAPEVYEKTPTYPEPVLKYPEDLVSPEVINSPEGVWYANGPAGQYVQTRGMSYDGGHEEPEKPWWRRKRGILVITAVAAVAVIAIVVGAVVGTRFVLPT